MENVGKWLKDSLDTYKMQITQITLLKTLIATLFVYAPSESEFIKHFVLPIFLIFDFVLWSLCRLHIKYLNDRQKLLDEYSDKILSNGDTYEKFI